VRQVVLAQPGLIKFRDWDPATGKPLCSAPVWQDTCPQARGGTMSAARPFPRPSDVDAQHTEQECLL
jgi:hypothetical protein